MNNRYGDFYTFYELGEGTYELVGNLKYWRYGGKQGQAAIDFSDLGFVDPSGGPFIGLGYKIGTRQVKRIYVRDERIFLDTE